MLASSPLSAETMAEIEGRYAAERDAGVAGDGGGGRRARDGRDFDMVPVYIRVSGYFH